MQDLLKERKNMGFGESQSKRTVKIPGNRLAQQ